MLRRPGRAAALLLAGSPPRDRERPSPAQWAGRRRPSARVERQCAHRYRRSDAIAPGPGVGVGRGLGLRLWLKRRRKSGAHRLNPCAQRPDRDRVDHTLHRRIARLPARLPIGAPGGARRGLAGPARAFLRLLPPEGSRKNALRNPQSALQSQIPAHRERTERRGSRPDSAQFGGVWAPVPNDSGVAPVRWRNARTAGVLTWTGAGRALPQPRGRVSAGFLREREPCFRREAAPRRRSRQIVPCSDATGAYFSLQS